MAKNSNYRYERFVADDAPAELYGWKYGIDNSKTRYDTRKEQRTAALKSPYAVYLLALIAFMLFWFAYSFVNAVKTDGVIALIKCLPSFFVLAVCAVIVFLSVFGVWGKFVRWALKKKMVGGPSSNGRILQAEIEEADANKGVENALNIFEDYIEIVNRGERKVVNRSLLRNVLLKKYGRYCKACFVSLRGETVYADAEIPSADIYKLKEIFVSMCTVEKGARRKKEDKGDPVFYVKETFEISVDKIGGLIMGVIFVAAGGGIITMHYCLNEKIPAFLGLFFIVGGLLAMLTVFDNVAVIKAFGIPFLFGVLFAGFPFMFVFSVAQSEGISVVLPSFHGFLCSFSPIYAGIFFIAGMGVLLILYAFIQLIKYLKHRK